MNERKVLRLELCYSRKAPRPSPSTNLATLQLSTHQLNPSLLHRLCRKMTRICRLTSPLTVSATNRLGSSGHGSALEQATRGYLSPPPPRDEVIKLNQTAIRLNFDPWGGECTVEGFVVSYGPADDWKQGNMACCRGVSDSRLRINAVNVKLDANAVQELLSNIPWGNCECNLSE